MNLTSKGNFHSFWFALPRRPPNALPACIILWHVKCHLLFLLVMIFPLLCCNELRHDAFHFVELLLNRTNFFHTTFIVLGATRALLVALAFAFLDNMLFLIIGQGLPMLVKPCEDFSIRSTDARLWSPFSSGIAVFVMDTSIRSTTNASCCNPTGGMKLW